MTSTPGFPAAPLAGQQAPASLAQAAPDGWVRQIARIVNSLLGGKLNCTGSVTLAVSAGSTTITDARIGPFSVLLFMPQTADAAAEIGNGTLYVSSRSAGSAMLTHANNSQADRTFAVAIIG